MGMAPGGALQLAAASTDVNARVAGSHANARRAETRELRMRMVSLTFRHERRTTPSAARTAAACHTSSTPRNRSRARSARLRDEPHDTRGFGSLGSLHSLCEITLDRARSASIRVVRSELDGSSGWGLPLRQTLPSDGAMRRKRVRARGRSRPRRSRGDPSTAHAARRRSASHLPRRDSAAARRAGLPQPQRLLAHPDHGRLWPDLDARPGRLAAAALGRAHALVVRARVRRFSGGVHTPSFSGSDT